MKFDSDIIKSFIKNPLHREDFFVFDNIFIGGNGNIVAVYRSPFEERVHIPMSDYNAEVARRKRADGLDKLI